MVIPGSFKVALAVTLIISVGFFSYQAGYHSCENKYLKVENKVILKETQEAAKIDQQVVEGRQQKVEVLTRVITKVQREIIQLPTHDCGFTHDERVSVGAAYCAGFPDSPSCLSNEMSNSSGTSP